ncbi:MAG: hypothetical protein ACI9G1_003681 [Pirellulaceae bacterium]|jgi:hypothetical protein
MFGIAVRNRKSHQRVTRRLTVESLDQRQMLCGWLDGIVPVPIGCEHPDTPGFRTDRDLLPNGTIEEIGATYINQVNSEPPDFDPSIKFDNTDRPAAQQDPKNSPPQDPPQDPPIPDTPGFDPNREVGSSGNLSEIGESHINVINEVPDSKPFEPAGPREFKCNYERDALAPCFPQVDYLEEYFYLERTSIRHISP